MAEQLASAALSSLHSAPRLGLCPGSDSERRLRFQDGLKVLPLLVASGESLGV